jgi:hypothetical protein
VQKLESLAKHWDLSKTGDLRGYKWYRNGEPACGLIIRVIFCAASGPSPNMSSVAFFSWATTWRWFSVRETVDQS